MAYTQANRPFRITTTLGDDALLLAGFAGVESISHPFELWIDLLSEDPGIAGADLLRQPVTVTVNLQHDNERQFHGLVKQFMQFGLHDKLTAYRMEVVPALWFLKLTGGCRIFQRMSVKEIVEKVLKENGVSDHEFRLNKSYSEREYCVQYRESHFDFVSRLLEDEGIHYFFEHSDGGHTLVLTDDATSASPCPHAEPASMAASPEPWQLHDVIVELTNALAVHTGKVALRDYDPLQPSVLLESNAAGKQPGEWYDYPGKFTKNAEGARYAKLQVDENSSRHQMVQGTGNCCYFLSGHTFQLE